MKISVIIPVFNAAKYLRQSLTSALAQKTVHEVIAVDDGSGDDSRKILQEFSLQTSRLKWLTHEGGQNLGRSATRNLGIKNACSEWIAFLDADDFYRSGRFDHIDDQITRDTGGIYDTIDTCYEKKNLQRKFPFGRTGLRNAKVAPEDLMEYLIVHDDESVHLNGLIVRKDVLLAIGGFDSALETGEDTDLIWRLALHTSLVPGDLTGRVACRRIHGANIILNEEAMFHGRRVFYTKWNRRSDSLPISDRAKKILRKKYLYYTGKTECFPSRIHGTLSRFFISRP